MIPLSVPNFIGNELKYITEAIETEWVSTAGPYISLFERKVADYVGAKGAVACQNGTAGLHIALLVSGVTKEQEVIVPTLTFIAAVNPVRYIGAEPVFMDCDDSLCMDPKKLKEFCSKECIMVDNELIHLKTKKKIKCIIVVHVFGNMADMDSIMDIAEMYHLNVIEDATEALGTYYTSGKYKGKHAGTIGSIGVYSFNGNKIITTGGGGMIVSENIKILKEAKYLTTQAKNDELYFVHNEIGYNYRMTNLQAALGLAQLEQLEKFIKIKNDNYYYYKEKLRYITGLSLLDIRSNIRSNRWFYSLYCGNKYILKRDELIQHMTENEIQTRPIWGLIHEQKPYKKYEHYKIEKAIKYRKHIVNIPCSTNLNHLEIDYVVNTCNIRRKNEDTYNGS